MVLGFDAVRNIAITVLLFEHLQNKGNANQLKDEFLRANFAGILAKDVGIRTSQRDVEQAFICSMFYNLGRMLAQYYFPRRAGTSAAWSSRRGSAKIVRPTRCSASRSRRWASASHSIGVSAADR